MSVCSKISVVIERAFEKICSYLERHVFERTALIPKKKRLLILKIDSIGDYVLFRNFLQVIKESEKFKDYSITLCGNIWWKDLAVNFDSNYVDRFVWIDYYKMSQVGYRIKKYLVLHSLGCETLIHPTYSRCAISDDIVLHSGAKMKIGYDGDTTNLTPEQKTLNDKFYSVLIPSPTNFLFEFYRNKYFFEQVLEQKIDLEKPFIGNIQQRENLIVICPGAKDFYRRWGTEKIAELCKMLKNQFSESEFVICGAQQDSILAQEIIAKSKLKFTDYTGKLSLSDFVYVLSNAKFVLCNDSAAYHLAIALDKKVVCISNGNNYGRFSPYPVQMKTKSIVEYPEELTILSDEQERLKRFCGIVTELDINTIQPNQVVKKIWEVLFVNEN